MIPALEKATALRQAPLFARLAPEELLALADLADLVTYEKDEVVFSEGEPADALFVVARGQVRVDRQGAPLTTLGVGESVGELGLLEDAARSATVVALARSELLRLDRDDFLDTLALYPAVVRSLLGMLAARLRADSGGGA